MERKSNGCRARAVTRDFGCFVVIQKKKYTRPCSFLFFTPLFSLFVSEERRVGRGLLFPSLHSTHRSSGVCVYVRMCGYVSEVAACSPGSKSKPTKNGGEKSRQKKRKTRICHFCRNIYINTYYIYIYRKTR